MVMGAKIDRYDRTFLLARKTSLRLTASVRCPSLSDALGAGGGVFSTTGPGVVQFRRPSRRDVLSDDGLYVGHVGSDGQELLRRSFGLLRRTP